MRRGDVIGVAVHGSAGKPRPALIVQSDLLLERATVLVVPFTSELADLPLRRVVIAPSATKGLRRPSQLMFELITPAQRDKCRDPFGRLDDDQLAMVDAHLGLVLGLAAYTA